jgi:glutathione synthase/RimK-type ligase-like ATP-grasp enzyme
MDKIYLRELEARGIAIPNTLWLERLDGASLERAMAAHGWDRAVLKPRIAATAHGTFLVSHGTELSTDDLAPARATGALLQEFVPEIETSGEISMVFCDGEFSHAVSKLPTPGDFRVQQDFGGSVVPVDPPARLLAFAEQVMTTVAAGTLYARVDCVETPRGPLLMEIELIEPELYFTVVDAAADRMAAAIIRRIS